jgi:hypothetical protein
LTTCLEEYGQLGEAQRQDMRQRVRWFLEYVATEGQINPREVKRYINAYTLHRMIGPDLNPDIILAVQTLDFRGDWEEMYENVVLADPDLFVEALERYRSGDDHAFEDLWPKVGVLPLELSRFLRSDQCGALTSATDLERYVSLVETTRSSQGWVKDAIREVGMLRRHTRLARPPLRIGSPEAREMAVQLKDILGRLRTYATGAQASGLAGTLDRLAQFCDELASATIADKAPEADIATWQQRMVTEIDRVQQELRLIRRSSAFGAG